MTRGKSICNVLKTIRKQIADANEIKYEPRECHHQGECRGTCPACEAEVRYIEQQLDVRKQLGKAVAIVGISAGLSALTSCGKAKKVDEHELAPLAEGKVMVEPAIHIDGDVEYQSPVDTAIIEERTDTAKVRTAKFRKPQITKGAVATQEMLEQESCLRGVRTADAYPKPEPLITVGEVPCDLQDEDKEFDVVEIMPSYPGGHEALLKYLSENITYPKECEDVCVQGRVVVTFVVEKDGSISNAKVVKSVYQPLDEEALRVVNSMPKWIPGQQNGKPLRVKYTIPVTFRLE